MADNHSISSVRSSSPLWEPSQEPTPSRSEDLTSITNVLDSSILSNLTEPVRAKSEDDKPSQNLNVLTETLNIASAAVKQIPVAVDEGTDHVTKSKTSDKLLNNPSVRAADAHLRKDLSTVKSSNRSLRRSRNLASQTDYLGLISSPKMAFTSPRAVALLVASLGNPPPYQSTRHSAGHIILKHLQYNLLLPPFQKSKAYGSGFVSLGADVGRPEFTLWQSPSLMNTSGPSLLQAYKTFLNAQQASATDPITGLVVLHDEMETEPGKIKVRRSGNSSAKGHNGIKSVQASFSGGGLLSSLGDRFVKIGIGIGRPSGGSRESKDVSAYVLGQLTSREKDGLDSAARDIENVLYQEMARMQQQQQKQNQQNG